MQQGRLFTILMALVFALPHAGFAEGERVIRLGGPAGWEAAETRTGIEEVNGLRPFPVLALSSSEGRYEGAAAGSADLYLPFDEGKGEGFADSAGHYRTKGDVTASGPRWARSGTGAALFTPGTSLQIKAAGPAMFAPNSDVGGFSIEFWLYPQTMETGEHILSWVSFGGGGEARRMQCGADRNRLSWQFTNFFQTPSAADSSAGFSASTIKLSGLTALVPGQWSRHTLRFDAATGLLEYLRDGQIEAAAYTTASGREGGEVRIPRTGRDGVFTLGGNFSGMIDEFRITDGNEETAAALTRYQEKPGRFESRPLDLGQKESSPVWIEAFGGRARAAAGGYRNRYEGTLRKINLEDDSALRFFVRSGGDPFALRSMPWQAFVPGTALPAGLRGRYLQIAAELYPSGDRESSPYLEEIHIVYYPNQPPRPPRQITAKALDGAVELTWRESPDRDTAGYLVYYGNAKGEYFAGPPVDAGNVTSVRVEGLKNGTLYYFAVAAYDTAGLWEALESSDPAAAFHSGEFSREVSARPLAGLSPRPVDGETGTLARHQKKP